MSESLAIIEGIKLPKGVTKRQMRLAALLPRCETAAEAMRLAGYSEVTIRNNGYRQVALGGVKRATLEIERTRVDSARGLMAVGHAALASNVDDLKDLQPRDRLAAGFKAIELAHQLGENIEQTGSGDAWKMRIRRACRLMARLTEARLLATASTQDVVLSPTHNISATANQQNDKLS